MELSIEFGSSSCAKGRPSLQVGPAPTALLLARSFNHVASAVFRLIKRGIDAFAHLAMGDLELSPQSQPSAKLVEAEESQWTPTQLAEQLHMRAGDVLEIHAGLSPDAILAQQVVPSTLRNLCSACLTLGCFGSFVPERSVTISGLKPDHRRRLLTPEEGSRSTRTAQRLFGDLLVLARYRVRTVTICPGRQHHGQHSFVSHASGAPGAAGVHQLPYLRGAPVFASQDLSAIIVLDHDGAACGVDGSQPTIVSDPTKDSKKAQPASRSPHPPESTGLQHPFSGSAEVASE